MTSPWTAGRLTVGRRARVMFGRMYEDHAVELDAFEPAARVLAIASAGDTAIALAQGGHRVTAVDINPVQLAYARARAAGGPTVAGTAERLMMVGRSAAAMLARSWRPAALRRFLCLSDPRRQIEWWREELDRGAVPALLAASLAPVGPLAVILARSLRGAVPDRLDLALRQRIAAGVATFPNAGNPWAWQLLLGQENPDDAHRSVGSGAPRISWLHADVAAHLAGVGPGSYDAVALSNVLDGASPAFSATLWAGLRRAVRPGGVVVIRSFGDRPPWPGRALLDRSLLWGSVTAVDIGDC